MNSISWSNVKRMVVKVGTSSLCGEDGRLDPAKLERIAAEIAGVREKGPEVILVSSGAIGAGMARLGMKTKPTSIPEVQATAAVGQGLLMQLYEKAFGERGIVVAQVLLTGEDLARRRRYLNSRNTLLTLLHLNVVPVVNENDTVAIDELRFGDNDTLSAMVAGLVGADLLVILSDVDGLYSEDPRKDANAVLIPEVREITPQLEAFARGAGSAAGTGGMITKLEAAKIALASGIPMVVVNSSVELVLTRILNGERLGTLFISDRRRLSSRQRWIAFHRRPVGSIVVDEGAEEALAHQGKSLLPIGVVEVRGFFRHGDLVSIVSKADVEIARGLTNYDSDELLLIKGRKSCDVQRILGVRAFDEVIHRDNMVLLGTSSVGGEAGCNENVNSIQR